MNVIIKTKRHMFSVQVYRSMWEEKVSVVVGHSRTNTSPTWTRRYFHEHHFGDRLMYQAALPWPPRRHNYDDHLDLKHLYLRLEEARDVDKIRYRLPRMR